MTSGVMYFRLAILISFFNQGLRESLLIPLGCLGAVGVLSDWVWSLQKQSGVPAAIKKPTELPQNPLELKAATLFAIIFVVMMVVTHYVTAYLGDGSVYALAGIMGVTDVDPFIIGAYPVSRALNGVDNRQQCYPDRRS